MINKHTHTHKRTHTHCFVFYPASILLCYPSFTNISLLFLRHLFHLRVNPILKDNTSIRSVRSCDSVVSLQALSLHCRKREGVLCVCMIAYTCKCVCVCIPHTVLVLSVSKLVRWAAQCTGGDRLAPNESIWNRLREALCARACACTSVFSRQVGVCCIY